MKIILADCYHDSDKGGGGIVAGALRSLEQVCARHEVEPEISLLFRFSRDDPKSATMARLTGREFSNCRILTAPISSRRGPGIHWLTWLFRAFIVAPLRLLLPQLSRHETVRAFREADVILFKGGNFYRSWGHNVVTDALATLLLVYPILLAWRMGKRFAIISHTFGPYHTRIARRIMGWLVRRARYVSCREGLSKDVLIECGVDAERIAVTPDTGFGATGRSTERVKRVLAENALTPGRYAVVTARPWFHAERRRGDHTRYEAYVRGAAALCDYLASGKVDKVALIVQNDGAHSRNEPDIEPIRDIIAAMERPDAAVVLDDDFSYDELVSLYGTALLAVGTRLHSCIFALAAGTPAIAIAYGHKAPGIMRMAGFEDFVLDISDLSVDDGRRMIDDMVARRDALAGALPERIDALRAEIDAMMEEALFG